MLELVVNGKTVSVAEGATVLEACIAAGEAVPHVCGSRELKTGGSCQMCLVGIEGRDRPVMSCCTPAEAGMRVSTETESVRKIRRTMVNLLLARHPADCNTCPKAGECPLQDACFACGVGENAFSDNSEPAEEQNLGPLIETHLRRCILCGKCLRFLNDVAGISEVTLKGRGSASQIKALVDGALACEVSGNLIDLCPAGALTDKTARFLYRPWELTRTAGIDVMDAAGSNIYIDAAEGRIARIVPRNAPEINGPWISDKTRFAFDGLERDRLDRPYIRIDGCLKECSWTEAFMTAASKIKTVRPERIAALIGDFADCESMMALRDLLHSIGADAVDARTDDAAYDVGCRQSWLFNTTFAGIEKADALLIIGADPRLEAPVVNLRLRANPMPKALVGTAADLTYPYEHLGDSPAVLEGLAAGTHPFAGVLKQAQRPMMIVGVQALCHPDGPAVLDAAYRIALSCGMISKEWNGFNLLQRKTSTVGALELGLIAAEPLRPKVREGLYDVVYLLNEGSLPREDLGGAFVIYQGIYATAAAHSADIVLPGLAYTEKRATYVNMEGRAQSTVPVLPPVGASREDWKILRALSEYLEKPLPYDDLEDVRDHLAGGNIIFYRRGEICPAENTPFGKPGVLSSEPFALAADRFFGSDEICRHSKIMQAVKKSWEETNG